MFLLHSVSSVNSITAGFQNFAKIGQNSTKIPTSFNTATVNSSQLANTKIGSFY